MIALDPKKYAHGTRARYVAGCRCDDCRASNTTHYHARRAQVAELEGVVRPSGVPIPSTMRRGGRDVRILRCPGADGDPCVVEGGAWLKGQSVCRSCVESATVGGGVDVSRARAHLLSLRLAGVGYKSVSAASDVAPSTICRVLAGEGTIRRQTERALLAVDASAIADHSLVDGATTRAILAWLVARGFTREHLAELLGSNSRALQVGKADRVLAITEARAMRLQRRVLAGEVQPERATVDASEERAWIALLLERGVPARHLSERLGYVVSRGQEGSRMFPQNRDAVRALRLELEEGDGLPEGWMLAADVATQALSGMAWTGDFSIGRRA